MKSLILDLILGDKGRKERREGARKERRKIQLKAHSSIGTTGEM